MYRTKSNIPYNSLVSMMAAQLLDAVIRETPANENIKHYSEVAQRPTAGAERPQLPRYPWSIAPTPLASDLWS